MVEGGVCGVGGPGPHQVRGPEEGGTLRGRAARTGPGFLRRKPGERAPWGAAPWTPARRRRFLPRDPLLWSVETGRGAFYRLSAACGPHSARRLRRAVLRAAGDGGWYPSGGDGRGHLHFAGTTAIGQNFTFVGQSLAFDRQNSTFVGQSLAFPLGGRWAGEAGSDEGAISYPTWQENQRRTTSRRSNGIPSSAPLGTESPPHQSPAVTASPRGEAKGRAVGGGKRKAPGQPPGTFPHTSCGPSSRGWSCLPSRAAATVSVTLVISATREVGFPTGSSWRKGTK